MASCGGAGTGSSPVGVIGGASSQVPNAPQLSLFPAVGTSPSPTANKTNYSVSDEIGKTFRAYFSQGLDGSTPSTPGSVFFGAATMAITSSTTASVTPQNGPTKNYVLYQTQSFPQFGYTEYTYAESGGSENLRIKRYSHGGQDGDVFIFGGGVNIDYGYGFATPPANFPSAIATYTGSSRTYFVKDNDQNAALKASGGLSLAVDFSNKTVTGLLSPFGGISGLPGTITLVDGTLVGSEVVAKDGLDIGISDPADPSLRVTGQSSELLGQLSGQSADVIHGSFGGSFSTSGSSGASTYSYGGSFRGDKQ